MKSASKTLYTIGRIINIIQIVVSLLIAVLGVVTIIMPEEIAAECASRSISDFDSPAEVRVAGITILTAAVVMFIVALIIYLFAKKATKALKEDSTNSNPHVIMLVIGIFGDIFYFLGGLFGILNTNEKPTDNQ